MTDLSSNQSASEIKERNHLTLALNRYLREKIGQDHQKAAEIGVLENSNGLDPLRFLKAYLNILDFWGYGYSWLDIYDAQFKPAVVISVLGIPVQGVRRSDLMYIMGRPHKFFVATEWASNWEFSCDTGLFQTFIPTAPDERKQDGPISTPVVIGEPIIVREKLAGRGHQWMWPFTK